MAALPKVIFPNELHVMPTAVWLAIAIAYDASVLTDYWTLAMHLGSYNVDIKVDVVTKNYLRRKLSEAH